MWKLRTKYLLSIGGLGNQLFVCNFAHQLVELQAKKIIILTGWHKNNERNSGLAHLLKNCSHPIEASDNHWLYVLIKLLTKVQTFLLTRNLPSALPVLIEEFPNPKRNLLKHTFYSGYFQKNEYFPARHEMTDEIRTTCDQILQRELKSVKLPIDFTGVHIRRGDYLNHSKTFGLLSENYFRVNSTGIKNIIIASDDPKLDPQGYISSSAEEVSVLNQTEPWQIFAILSKANLLITSNSSFSFWAGLVALSRGGRAVIPEPWFRDHPQYTPDLLYFGLESAPSEWSN